VGERGADEVIDTPRRLAVVFVILALTGCAHGVTAQAGAPYAPVLLENAGSIPEHGGGDGGGGGAGM
jgi:hypothetical protein